AVRYQGSGLLQADAFVGLGHEETPVLRPGKVNCFTQGLAAFMVKVSGARTAPAKPQGWVKAAFTMKAANP
ncbi:hypothetical protein, partial [Geoalkalibacter sp.]|uniref:hypothetical protein n=1 Tax=Geoalkalibacter sp. TaxID=3041440 RepID=UPI00272DF4D1